MFKKRNILFNIFYKLFVTIAINCFSFSPTDNMDDAMPAKKIISVSGLFMFIIPAFCEYLITTFHENIPYSHTKQIGSLKTHHKHSISTQSNHLIVIHTPPLNQRGHIFFFFHQLQ